MTGKTPSPDARVKPVTELAARLCRELEGEVLFDHASRGRYSTDASIYQVMPLGVVIPRSQEDLALALAIARDAGAPVLPRGAGTSQCGQTVGEALVIDTTRFLNQVIEFDAEARTAVVEPGIVLDHLNAWLKPHGLWFPVDVSTSAQCTVGGMTGNNSCGSRSIRYGNMVHNVLGVDALLADGGEASFSFVEELAEGSRARLIADKVKAIAAGVAPEIREHFPKVLRRVGGYNLDLFDCQNPKPYDPDGRINLAHLLVGSEGTLAVSRRITLRLSPLPEHKVLGVVNFPTFYQAMDFTQHIVKLDPTAVELVDRTMIDLSLENPAFRPVIEKALIGKPEAVLLVEFAGQDRDAQLAALRQLSELMCELGLPGSVVDMPEPAEQKALWNVRKAGLNIMMSMKGDGKPVSFIEDCAVPLEHLAEYTDKLTEVFHRHGTEAPGTPTPVSAPCMCARSSTCAATVPRRCARSPSRRRHWCASTRGPTPASTAMGYAAANGWPGSSGLRSTMPFAKSSGSSIRTTASTRARSSTPRRWTTTATFASPGITGRSR
ncbi:hypothetical protein Q427_12880 [Halomonas sp. BC04]|nr:hypothetical protein Q427_12880 [Halomonas sp. BC04]